MCQSWKFEFPILGRKIITNITLYSKFQFWNITKSTDVLPRILDLWIPFWFWILTVFLQFIFFSSSTYSGIIYGSCDRSLVRYLYIPMGSTETFHIWSFLVSHSFSSPTLHRTEFGFWWCQTQRVSCRIKLYIKHSVILPDWTLKEWALSSFALQYY